MAFIENVIEIVKVVKQDLMKLISKLPKMKKDNPKVISIIKEYKRPNLIKPSITKKLDNDIITKKFLNLIERENAQFTHYDNSSQALTGTTYIPSIPSLSATYESKIDIKRRIRNCKKIATNILEELP